MDGFAAVPLGDPLVGRTLLGQFQIQAACGRGATGTVYRAQQLGMDRLVAIKVLRADLLRNPEIVRRFIREARAGARLSHPNIATVHLVGETEEGAPYIVMEYVDGVPLSLLLDRLAGSVPTDRALHIAEQVAGALGEAHGHGIIHRDLKPENILLTERRGEHDVVKVVDFGIAKIVLDSQGGPEDPVSRMGTVFGTPHYIAPEQAAGGQIDTRADLYALGCVLFQMLTGRVPFDGPNGIQVLLRHAREAPPNPRVLNPGLPEPVAELLLALLQKDPAARPQKAEAVAQALRALREELPRLPQPSRLSTAEALAGLGGGAAGEGRAAARAGAARSGAAVHAVPVGVAVPSGRPQSGAPASAPAAARSLGDEELRAWVEPDAAPAPRPTSGGRAQSAVASQAPKVSARAADADIEEAELLAVLPFWQRHRRALAGMVLAVLVGLGVGGALAVQRNRGAGAALEQGKAQATLSPAAPSTAPGRAQPPGRAERAASGDAHPTPRKASAPQERRSGAADEMPQVIFPAEGQPYQVEALPAKPSKPAKPEAAQPVESAPAARPAPVEARPAPVEAVRPAPVEARPAPVESAPAAKPAPVEAKPAPVEAKPAPVESAPAARPAPEAPRPSEPAPRPESPEEEEGAAKDPYQNLNRN